MDLFESIQATRGLNVFIAFLALGILEACWISFKRRQHYDVWAALSSLSIMIGKQIIDGLTAGVAFIVLYFIYQIRLFDIEMNNLWSWLLLIALFELAYYWNHRLAHEVRWFWATHSVHHSPNQMNLSVAARLGWTNLLSASFMFFAPIVLLGFHPIAVFIMLSLSLFYQVWIHTELIDKLPRWFEFVFNTPSHHRVHHASNIKYLDKNYGGMLIFYDRLFGTFVEEVEKPVYGLVTPLKTNNPFKIAFHEWIKILKDLKKQENKSHKLAILFAPPGWSKNYRRKMTAIKIENPFKSKSTPSKHTGNKNEEI